MKKRAYWSSDYKETKPVKNVPVGLTDQDSATENAGRNGISLLERTTEPLMLGGTDPSHYDDPGAPDVMDEDEKQITKRVFDLLARLGDDMDLAGEHNFANFSDFLMKKFGEAKEKVSETDYSVLYNDLMLKINNSDLTDRNDTIKKLTKIYSRTLVLEYSRHDDMEKAKGSAYSKTLHRADQYLSGE